MESSKPMLIILFVLPTVLIQTTLGTTTDLQTSAVATDLPTGAATTPGTTDSEGTKALTTPEKTEATVPGSTETTIAPGQTQATEAPGQTEATDAPGQTEDTDAPGQTEATDAPGQTEATDAPGQTEATDAPAQTEATDAPGQTEATDAPGQTEATDAPGQTEATDAGQTEATDAPGQTEATDATPGKTEGPNPHRTTIEAIEPEEVILTVTTTLVNYPDDKIVTVGGGALVTISATVEIVNQVNGSVDVIDDMRVFVYAANSEMEELSSGIEVSLDPFNLTVNESVSFNKLNATLALNDVLCTTFTHVCVRVEPATNAVWKIAAEGSTDRSCDEISCDSGSAKLAVSGVLLALCLFISRLSGVLGD